MTTVVPTRTPSTSKPPSERARSRRRNLTPYLFLTPNLIVFTVFVFAPLVFAVWMSFHKWDTISPAEWVGFSNFTELLGDKLFWESLKNTFIFGILTVPTSLVLGLIAALGLNQKLPGRVFMRTIYFLPFVVSSVVIGTLGSWVFNDTYGIINATLDQIGLGEVSWLTDPNLAMITLSITTVWARLGFCMIVYLAALQTIPPEYLEASTVDGSTPWQTFRYITLPLLMPATFLLAVLNIIYSFEAFDLVFVMTGGGPGNSTTVLPVYAFDTAFQVRRFGYANAIGLVLMVIIMIITLIQWRVTRQDDIVV